MNKQTYTKEEVLKLLEKSHKHGIEIGYKYGRKEIKPNEDYDVEEFLED